MPRKTLGKKVGKMLAVIGLCYNKRDKARPIWLFCVILINCSITAVDGGSFRAEAYKEVL